MKAIQIEGNRRIAMLDNVPRPEPGDGEVLVQCTHVALCGSNMGQYTSEGIWGDLDYPNPVGWAGHENLGRIVESRCDEWKPGTLVLSQPEGYFGFAEYIVSRPPAIAVMPQDEPDPASLMVAQPLSTVLRAMAQTEHVINQRCVVIGQGPMGLILTYVLRIMGAREVIAVDLLDWRLEWSKRYGADHVIDASQENVIEAVTELTGGELADFVVDAAGRPESLATAAHLPKHGARLYVFGMPHFNDQEFPWYAVFRNETQIVTSIGPDCGSYFQVAMDMVVDGRASILRSMVTPIMSWDKAPEAFEMYVDCARDSLKLTLEV
ncbi:zinc-binding dehydrogenase [Candidatus Hydrogenedentota bacterium]